ncbi:MAG: HAMP domain-containing sensor histidine kinase [Alphaproteobacteria bacterium]
MHLLRSVASKLLLLTIIFVGVPILVYQQFRAADDEKTTLLMRAISEQGTTLAMSLSPALKALTPKTIDTISAQLTAFQGTRVNIKVLLWPGPLSEKAEFYYIASLPAFPKDYRDQELASLRNSSVFDRLDESCASATSMIHRYVNPAGKDELLTSVVPVLSPAGCWLVITSNLTSDLGGTEIGTPYWSRFQVQLSLAVYLGMAAIVLALLIGLRRNLLKFAQLARDIRQQEDGGHSFQTANNIPELAEVAKEFDAMVSSLKISADAIRATAEESAHAMKTPIGVLVQAVEPIRKSLQKEDERGHRSVERMELAIDRLVRIIDRNRRFGEITAEALNPSREILDLNHVVEDLVEEIRRGLPTDAPSLDLNITRHTVLVRSNRNLIVSALDNLIENAISFSEAGGRVRVEVKKNNGYGVLTVSDQGPGADQAVLNRMFEHSFSHRTNATDDEHFGLGLWIVRRNVLALGGTVHAENIDPKGLRVTIELPLQQ